MLNEDNFNDKKEELQEKIKDYLSWFDKCCPIDQDKNNNSNLLKIPFDEKKNEK